MNETSGEPEFSKLRRIFFPVHRYELKKVIPMGMILFFILFNYTCLRNIKDSLVVTNTGAEALSYLKLFCVTPSAIVFMLLYAKASNILSNEKLFYATLSPFILFFGLFAFVIYPNREWFHPTAATIASWQTQLPILHWPLALFGVWSYSVFYVLSELWGSALLSLSFWQFANQVTRVSEAKRVYAFFGLMAQFSLLFSGVLGDYFSNISDKVSPGVDPWQISLNWLMGTVVLFGIVTMCIYRWIYKCVLTDKRFYDKPELPGIKKGKKKAGLIQSLKTIFTSPYLGLIAMLVICYGISTNVIEGLWKSQLKLQYHNENDYNTFMSRFTILTGLASIVMLIVGGNILRICRWVVAAMSTPVVFLVGGTVFFSFVLFRQELTGILVQWGTNPVTMAVFLGAAIVIVSKSTKYALFDLTKEMAYIPLDEEMKVKGKAVVEVVGGRLGKSGGAFIQVALFSIVSSLAGVKATYYQIVPYVFALFILGCIVWIVSVNALGKRVENANREAGEA
ncbi:MAG: NTP/NDP exchange transporter [Puniceicoccales bacterium]|jgi:AAA family ATP:ADP antiporter|nr:NTP/NDP exchange transporter [Puniceicoccales bacterium]